MAKTDITVTLEDDKTVRGIVTKVVKALRHANKPKLAETFQREAFSGGKGLMETVKEYVVLV
jgi:hypothetical protein